VTRPGGTVGAYVWDYAGQMQLMRYFWDAAGALDPRARELDEGVRFPLCRPEPLQALQITRGEAPSLKPQRSPPVPARLSDTSDQSSVG
jgi:hypothetical protein